MVHFLFKEMRALEFKTLFSILKQYLADGDDVPAFFRELMAMITTVTEEEWGTQRDPSSKLSDQTIRSYTKVINRISEKYCSTTWYSSCRMAIVHSMDSRGTRRLRIMWPLKMSYKKL